MDAEGWQRGLMSVNITRMEFKGKQNIGEDL